MQALKQQIHIHVPNQILLFVAQTAQALFLTQTSLPDISPCWCLIGGARGERDR